LTSQYLNLAKNSSLAAGIGYPDMVSLFAGTTLNQTGPTTLLGGGRSGLKVWVFMAVPSPLDQRDALVVRV
ncbi:hypothetical protein R0G64_31605, partial [Pseudomonas otitidis]